MTKIKKTNFKKGQSGNPKGKVKGTINKSTLRFARLKALASEKYEDAFNMLWKNMEIGEGWAHQIYFKELVPKRIHQQTIIISNDDEKNRLDAVVEALPQFTELTHDEAMNEIRTFKTIEQESEKKESESIFAVMSDSQVKQVLDIYNEAKKNCD